MFSKNKVVKSTFSDFIKGLQYSINTAQEIIESHNIQTLNKFFDKNGVAKTQILKIDEDNEIRVPLISIVNHNNLSIDELEVEFEANLLGIDVNSFKTNDFDTINQEIERTKFYIDFVKNSRDSQMKVKIKFKSDDNPEGMERIKTEFDKQIIPHKNDKK
jgi:hypothetical protein